MNIDLRLVRVELDWSPSVLYLWHFRNHFKRYVKRYIPRFKYTCDWCRTPIRTGQVVRSTQEPFWVAACPRCAELGWGWLATGSTAEEAMESWRRHGGDEFKGKVAFRPAPPWVKRSDG